MLKKLRLKFIITNMAIVTILLGVLFNVLYFSISKNLENDAMRTMGRIAEQPVPYGPPNREPENIRLPYFSVLLDDSGEIKEVHGEYFDLSDNDMMDTLATMTENSSADRSGGILRDYNLRYIRIKVPEGERIVFADMTTEQATLKHLVQSCALVGGISFIVFLLISILLARWAVKPVEKAWQQQKQFVADASHELKTPLTVIMTDAELLHSPDCTQEDSRQLSGSIMTMSGQMKGLVESLLELARVDNGSVKDELRDVDFSEIVSNASMIFEPLFFEKEMTLEYEVDPDIQIKGYGAHLKQLPDILLDNALKYASAGGKTILSLKRNSHNYCVLEVSNEGEPISKEDLPNLFKRFYRADKARSMNHSYGLGLSIAQSVADEHHGRIHAESSDGFNRFYVELPMEVSRLHA